ncbi:unnamed protein product [Moneuplotes crassus]|uniref:Uncharacterized protein n=1 Tax=Euplotes crassus TaxID=5936 RepID=A0AAD1XM40_EUPCR|nr:unnamed protein product [Moneuplotes crassus]
MHGLNNENTKITRHAVNLSKIRYIPEKVPKEINRNNVLKTLICHEKIFSRFLDPSRKLISVDYMLNVLNAASVGAIGMFLKCMERIDTLLFKKPSKIKDEYCIEKGLENEDMRRQLKCSLNKTLKYQWIKSEKSKDDGGISDCSLSDSDKENDPKNGIKENKKSKHKLWEKSILITIDWVYGLDKYYSEANHKNAPILSKEKFEMHLAKARFIINFPEQWLGYITKGCGTVPYEKYADFDGFNLHSIEKGPKFDEISRFIKKYPSATTYAPSRYTGSLQHTDRDMSYSHQNLESETSKSKKKRRKKSDTSKSPKKYKKFKSGI